jgi:hypothetical protein
VSFSCLLLLLCTGPELRSREKKTTLFEALPVLSSWITWGHRFRMCKVSLVVFPAFLAKEKAAVFSLLKERGSSDLNNYTCFRQNGALYVMQIQIMGFFM